MYLQMQLNGVRAKEEAREKVRHALTVCMHYLCILSLD